MILCHLSPKESWLGIVATTETRTDRTLERGYMRPRIPRCFTDKNDAELFYREPDVKRISCCPTAWQAVYPVCGNEDVLYVYQLDVTDPDPAQEVVDSDISDERWITDGVVSRCGGLVPLELVGIINDFPGVQLYLKPFHVKKENRVLLPSDPSKEVCMVWNIVDAGDGRPSEWVLNKEYLDSLLDK